MFIINRYYDKNYGKIKASAIRKDENVYIGRTHAECLIQQPIGVLRNAEQGFITDKDIFVDRKLALKIAKHYKQVKYKHPPYDQLMSEDLYYSS